MYKSSEVLYVNVDTPQLVARNEMLNAVSRRSRLSCRLRCDWVAQQEALPEGTQPE